MGDTYWHAIDLDLTGATLINFDLANSGIRIGTFNGAQFTGDAWFDDAQFTGNAEFDRARFTGKARFDGARFTGNAGFDGAQFARGIPETLKPLLPSAASAPASQTIDDTSQIPPT